MLPGSGWSYIKSLSFDPPGRGHFVARPYCGHGKAIQVLSGQRKRRESRSTRPRRDEGQPDRFSATRIKPDNLTLKDVVRVVGTCW